MEKVINIGGVDVKLSNNVGWAMEYRDQFGTDIIPVLLPMAQSMLETLASIISECGTDGITAKSIANAVQGQTIDIMVPMTQASFTDLVIGVAWAMAKAADETIDPPRRWVKQFESFPVDVIIPELLDMVGKGFASSKNLERLRGMVAELKEMTAIKSA